MTSPTTTGATSDPTTDLTSDLTTHRSAAGTTGPDAPGTDAVEEARALVAAVVHDDLDEAGAHEDLRDYGLDSIRLLAILDDLRAAGLRVRVEDLAAEPTLAALAGALAAARAA